MGGREFVKYLSTTSGQGHPEDRGQAGLTMTLFLGHTLRIEGAFTMQPEFRARYKRRILI